MIQFDILRVRKVLGNLRVHLDNRIQELLMKTTLLKYKTIREVVVFGDSIKKELGGASRRDILA